ncbi:extracellular solute-binding protein [Aquibacillus albus]|uniref:Raffinose/stachyose/melibiose transport system substrate-binding protein n=1 Tax=Aquibacillus albus TaxID=1168171 RepID=A0ABS2MX62_9BACI|nr:extracellular solute-binding protein [Aquibacillus albus]MBM7570285.1 raffinose/stachyose/melibiose transport system substrate-binding protein [Aquibacillus albus]
MKKKAFAYGLILSTIVMLVLAGCGGGQANGAGDESGSDGETKTIEFMHLWPEGSSKQHNEIVNGIIEEFESNNPGVTVDVEILGNEQYKEKLKVLSASNELPDVGMTWAAGFLQPYVKGEKFAELDGVIDENLSDSFVPGTTEAYAIDGATYGLPLELNITPVYYNKAIFDEYGLEAPETMDEFKQVVQTLVDNGVTPITLGNKDSWTGSMWYMYLADRIGGPETLTNAINRTGSFEDPALVQAAAEIQELVDMGAFVKGYNGLGNDEAKGYFKNEQAAMYLMATWDLPEWTTNEDNPQEFRDSVGYFKFPTVEGGEGDINSYVGGPGVGLFVAEDSDVKEEAKDFVSFFVQKWGEQSVTKAGVIPATKVDTEGIELPQMYIDVLNDLNDASNLTLYADVQMSASAAQVHLDMIQALFGGEVTPEEFAKAHEEALAAEEE